MDTQYVYNKLLQILLIQLIQNCPITNTKKHTYQTDSQVYCQWSRGSPGDLEPTGIASAKIMLQIQISLVR